MPTRATRLDFRILGPLEVLVDDVPIRVGGPKQRALLALLLLDANRVVSRDRLIEELLRDRDGEADHALRVQVSRLRKALDLDSDEPRLVARPPGYVLRVEPGELDLALFEQRAADGRRSLEEGEPGPAVDSLRKALALWRGRPLADLEFEPFVRIEVERLVESRLVALEDRIEAELALGAHATLVPELEALTAEHPFRERLWAQLMLALYRSGRQAEGLDVYRRAGKLLRDELGLVPGEPLQRLERSILTHDRALDLDGVGPVRTTGVRLRRAMCPYKGLEAFDADDAELFFGRERLVGELLARLAGTQLLAVIGPSGSGKSSLLRAGLLPALAAEGPGGGRCRAVVLRPGEHPRAELGRELGGELGETLERAGPRGQLVVAVDQFEELFAVCGDETERRAFVRTLVEAVWDPERRAVVLIAMRADFYGRLASHPALAELVAANHVLLGPMNERELRRAIEGPAGRAGLVVEPELVDALVGDVAGEAGGLPLLSTALVELWRERSEDALRLESYERIGRVQGAVARLAEAAYARLSHVEQQTARRLLLRLAAGGDGEAIVRRRVPVEELDLDQDEVAARVVAVLVESRLLTAGDGTVEVSHEALLHHWPRLRDWLDEDAEGRVLHRHLARSATDWDRGGRDSGELYRGTRLAAAEEWAETGEHPLELNALEREFLEESRSVSIGEAARKQRANRRLRTLLGLALVLLALSALAGLVAFEQRAHARNAATAAEAERLGAQALVEPSLDRSLLLAREAVALDDSLPTRSDLLAALQRSPAALAVLHGGGKSVLEDALSPDGRTLAVLDGGDGSVAFFDTSTLRRSGEPFLGASSRVVSYEAGSLNGSIRALAFSPDGETLAVGGANQNAQATLEILDLRTHHVRPVPVASFGLTADVAYSPDGHALVTGEILPRATPPSEVLVARDPRTGRALASSGRIPEGRLIGFAAGGRSVLVTSGQSRSMLLDPRRFATLRTFPIGGAAALAPSGETAALGQADGTVTVLDLRTGAERRMSTRATGAVLSLDFSRDGTTLATTSADGSIALWDVASAGEREVFRGHSSAVEGAVFSPDGRTLYSAGLDGSVIVWDVGGTRRLEQPRRLAGPLAPGSSAAAAASADGTKLATSGTQGRVTLWRARTLTRSRGLRDPLGDVWALAFSLDGTLLAATGPRGAVVWDARTGTIRRTLAVGKAGYVALSPDGRMLALGEAAGDVRLYNLSTGREARVLRVGPSLAAVDFSPKSRQLLTGDLAGRVTLWNVATGSRIFRTGFAAGDPVFAAGFSPDGRLVAAGDSNGTIAFWSSTDGHRVGRPLTGLDGGVSSIAFDQSGSLFVASSGDGKLQLYDVGARKLIGEPVAGAGRSAVFFLDGERVLAVSGGGTGVLWNVDPAAWTRRACRVAHRNLTRAEWQDMLPDRSYRNVCP